LDESGTKVIGEIDTDGFHAPNHRQQNITHKRVSRIAPKSRADDHGQVARSTNVACNRQIFLNFLEP